MKLFTRISVFTFLICFLFVGNLYSQDDKDKEKEDQIRQQNAQAEKVIDILNFLQKKAIEDLDKNKPCKAEAELYLKKIKFDPMLTKFHLAMLDTSFFHIKEPNGILPHSFLSWEDFALSIYSKTKDKNEFAKKLFDRTWIELKADEKKVIENLFELYKSEDGQWLYMRSYRDDFKRCYNVFVEFKIYPKKFNYPFIDWNFSYLMHFSCDCTKEDPESKLRVISARYRGDIKSVMTSEGMSFNIPTNVLGRNEIDCCNEPKEEEEEEEDLPRTELPKEEEPKKYSTDGKPISYTPANHNIGTGFGLGFEDSFNEIGICASFEYLNLLDLMDEYEDFLWFMGIEADFDFIFSEFFKSQSIKVGPKFQLNKVLPRVGNLQLVNGVSAQYAFTNNNGSSFTSTAHGLFFSLYTGFNMPIGDKVDLGLEIPVFNVNYNSVKYDEFEDRDNRTDFSLLMNKHNLVKFLLRIRLGE